jgi:hypothetical protein
MLQVCACGWQSVRAQGARAAMCFGSQSLAACRAKGSRSGFSCHGSTCNAAGASAVCSSQSSSTDRCSSQGGSAPVGVSQSLLLGRQSIRTDNFSAFGRTVRCAQVLACCSSP